MEAEGHVTVGKHGVIKWYERLDSPVTPTLIITIPTTAMVHRNDSHCSCMNQMILHDVL